MVSMPAAGRGCLTMEVTESQARGKSGADYADRRNFAISRLRDFAISLTKSPNHEMILLCVAQRRQRLPKFLPIVAAHG